MGDFSCKGCLARSAECHATCEKYQRESKAHQKELEEIRIQKEHHRHVLDTVYKSLWRN